MKNIIKKDKNKIYDLAITEKKISSGITLIALVITIVILLIFAGVTISSIGGNELFSKAKESAFKSKMASYKEEASMYVSWKITDTMNTDTKKINSGEVLKNAIDQEIVTDITKDDVSIDIKDILKDISNEEKEYIVVYKDELCYVSNKEIDNNDNQAKWCSDIGIKILEYTQPEGIVVKSGKYELINGIYLCTPKLDEGFEQEKTRYLEVNSNGYLTPGNWITDKTTDNWYDYKQAKWANIYVENNGSDVYYVWTPRYCFKLDQTNQRSIVKFIDGTSTETDSGYQIPEAFTFNAQELTGYWAMKYTAGQ